MSKFRDRIRAQEPWIDRYMTNLAKSQRTAEIVAVVVAIALGVGIVLWLI